MFAFKSSSAAAADNGKYIAGQAPLYPTPPDVPDQVLVEVTVDNIEHVFLRLDTAAPRTTMPAEQLANLGLKVGTHNIWIGSKASGVSVGQKLILELDATGTGPIDGPGVPAGTIIRGTAGTDLWKGYAIGLDFKDRRLWLFPKTNGKPLDAGDFPHPSSVDQGRTYEAELKIVDQHEGPVLYMKAGFDLNVTEGSFLVDTGASTVLVQEPYWNQIKALSDRSIPYDVTDFEGKVITGAFRLVPQLILDGQKLTNRQIVWALPQYPALASEGIYYDHQTDGLIGLWAWYRYFTVLDFDLSEPSVSQRILLFPYSEGVASLEETNFTGFGFSVKDEGGTVQVIEGTDAQKNGVKSGDIFVSADGPPLEFRAGGFFGGKDGERRGFHFGRGTLQYQVILQAETLF